MSGTVLPARVRIQLGLASVDVLSRAQALERVMQLAERQGAAMVVTPNADHLVRLQSDAQFQRVYAQADLVLADGMPLVWASWLKGPRLPERVAGSDLFMDICQRAALTQKKIFLLGGPPGVAPIAAAKLCRTYPGLMVVGAISPSFGFEKNAAETETLLQTINTSAADIVFVGVGSPKQELWIAAHRGRIKCGVLLGIGASIEFAAGTVQRAPKIMQVLGLEWAHRLSRDPRRLARRYWSNLAVFGILARSIMRR